MIKLKPSDFRNRPMASVLRKSEAETVASNIMVILSKGVDVFRALSWEEYKRQRLIDGKFSDSEHDYFDQVIDFFKSADTAKLFSKEWADK